VHFTIYMYLYLYSYRRETARQLRIHAQLTRCFSAVAELLVFHGLTFIGLSLIEPRCLLPISSFLFVCLGSVCVKQHTLRSRKVTCWSFDGLKVTKDKQGIILTIW